MKKSLLLSGLFLIFFVSNSFCQNETEKISISGYEFELQNIKPVEKSEILKEGILQNSITIKSGENELKLKTGKNVAFTFENNQLAYAYLDSSVKVKMSDNEMIFSGGSKISFATSFKGELFVSSACLAENTVIKSGNIEIAAKALKSETEFDIFFNRKGEITSLILEKETQFTIGEKKFSFAPNSKLTINNGTVRSGILSKTQVVDVNGLYKIPVKGERSFASTIEFDYSGKISMVYCAALCTIKAGGQSIPIKQDNYVSFNPTTGKIKFAYVGQKTQLMINGKKQTVDVGKQLEFGDKEEILVAK